MKRSILLLVLVGNMLFGLVQTAEAWEGYDYQVVNSVTIGPDNIMKVGARIRFWDNAAAEYRTGTIKDIDGPFFGADGAQIEIRDHKTRKIRVFIMNGK